MAYDRIHRKPYSSSPVNQPAEENRFAPRPFNYPKQPEPEVTPQPETYSREAYDLIVSRLVNKPPETPLTKQQVIQRHFQRHFASLNQTKEKEEKTTQESKIDSNPNLIIQAKCDQCEAKNQDNLAVEAREQDNSTTLVAMNPKGRCITPEEVNAWIIEGQLALAKGGNALLEFCKKLGQLIEDCHGELARRLKEMLNDRRTGQSLYDTRRTGTNSWEGHQKYYDRIRNESMPD
jgi:hypothetical protein